jgi:hypothetical protein
MSLKKIVSVGAVAAGLICSGAYAQASDPASGSFTGGPFRGVADVSVPGGVRTPETVDPVKTDPGKGAQGGGSATQTKSSDASGSSKGSGSSTAPAATSGSGSAAAGK